MRIIPQQSLDNPDPIRQQMEQMFDNILRAEQSQHTNSSTSWAPAIAIQETEMEIILKAEVPVFDAKDLTVEASQEAVLITGEYNDEQRTQEERKSLSKCQRDQYQRVVTLPAPIHNDQVKAEFKDGILTLTLPRKLF